MKQLDTPTSIRAYAKGLNINEKAVRKAIADGKIKKGFDKKTGKILPSKADAEWGHIHKVIKPQRGISKEKAAQKIEQATKETIPPPPEKKPTQPVRNLKEKSKKDNSEESILEPGFDYQKLIKGITITADLQYSEALRRKEILNIAKERMLLEEKNGSLVSRADVDKVLFKMGDTLKKAFLNIPARVIADLRAAENEIEASNLLTTEIQAVLSTVSNLKYLPNGN